MNSTFKPLLAKTLLTGLAISVPAGYALAAQDCTKDPFADYKVAFGIAAHHVRCDAPATARTGMHGRAGPRLEELAVNCADDPIQRVRSFLRDEASNQCLSVAGPASGARGPSGPLMEALQDSADDSGHRYRQVFFAD